MLKPTYYLRLSQVIALCAEHGIAENRVRECVTLGTIPKHYLGPPGTRAYYKRDEIASIFALPIAPRATTAIAA